MSETVKCHACNKDVLKTASTHVSSSYRWCDLCNHRHGKFCPQIDDAHDPKWQKRWETVEFICIKCAPQKKGLLICFIEAVADLLGIPHEWLGL